MKFKVAAVLEIGAVCAVAAACSSGPATTTSTQAPQVTVLTKGANNGNGDIFLARRQGRYR